LKGIFQTSFCQRAKIKNVVDRERERWAELANAALERHGHESRIDHRSHAERGIDRDPQRHLGPAAVGYERRTGEKSRKRLDYEAEAAEHKESSELEHQSRQIEQSILDLTGDLDAARRELAERQRLASMSNQELSEYLKEIKIVLNRLPPSQPNRELVEIDAIEAHAKVYRQQLEKRFRQKHGERPDPERAGGWIARFLAKKKAEAWDEKHAQIDLLVEQRKEHLRSDAPDARDFRSRAWARAQQQYVEQHIAWEQDRERAMHAWERASEEFERRERERAEQARERDQEIERDNDNDFGFQ